jgi:hypothetical protein
METDIPASSEVENCQVMLPIPDESAQELPSEPEATTPCADLDWYYTQADRTLDALETEGSEAEHYAYSKYTSYRSIITRTCKAIARHGQQLKSLPSVLYKVSEVVFGSAIGCEDCRLLLATVQFCSVAEVNPISVDLFCKIVEINNEHRELKLSLGFTIRMIRRLMRAWKCFALKVCSLHSKQEGTYSTFAPQHYAY